jgi:hypothetical protein
LCTCDDEAEAVPIENERIGRKNLSQLIELCVCNELGHMLDKRQTLRSERIDDGVSSDSLGGDELGCVLSDVVVEEVRGNCKGDGSTYVAQTKCDSGHSSDELVRASDLRNDRAWNNDTTYTESCNGHETIHEVEVLWVRNGHRAGAGSHHGREEAEQQADTTLGNWNENQTDDSSKYDTKSDGERSKTDTNGIITCVMLMSREKSMQHSLTIDIVNLGRPEEQQNKEVAATEERDQEDDDHSPLGLVE